MNKANDYRIAVASLAVVALTAAVLDQMGRQWWCSCGSPVAWSWDIWSSHNSQHPIDPYFFSHVLHGLVLYAVFRLLLPGATSGLRFLLAISVEA